MVKLWFADNVKFELEVIWTPTTWDVVLDTEEKVNIKVAVLVPEDKVIVWPGVKPPKKFWVGTKFKSLLFNWKYVTVESKVKVYPVLLINIPPPTVLPILVNVVTPLYVTQFWFVGAAAAMPKHISAGLI